MFVYMYVWCVCDCSHKNWSRRGYVHGGTSRRTDLQSFQSGVLAASRSGGELLCAVANYAWSQIPRVGLGSCAGKWAAPVCTCWCMCDREAYEHINMGAAIEVLSRYQQYLPSGQLTLSTISTAHVFSIRCCEDSPCDANWQILSKGELIDFLLSWVCS